MPDVEGMQAVWIAAIVAIPTVIVGAGVPIIMEILKNRSAMKIREEDRAARKEVAALAAEAVEELKKKAIADAKALQEINDKQDVLHLMGNSNLTGLIQANHDATARELVGLLEMQDLKKSLNRELTKESIGAIEVARAKLTDLRSQLERRAAETRLIEAEQKRQQNVTTSQNLAAAASDKPPEPVAVKVVESAADPVNVVPAKEKQ